MSQLVSINNDPQESYYRTVNLTALLDKSLSWKAKGIFYYMKTRPDNWVIHMEELFTRSSEGEAAVRSGITELIEAQYVHRVPIRKDGRIQQWTFLVFTKPVQLTELDLKKLLLDFLKVENLNLDDPALSYNINSKKKEKRKDSSEAAMNSSSVSDFELFWRYYPRKAGSKGSAKKAWDRACSSKDKTKRPPPILEIRKAIRAQERSEQWRDPKYIPYPTTWINQTRWMDSPAEMVSPAFGNNGSPAASPSAPLRHEVLLKKLSSLLDVVPKDLPKLDEQLSRLLPEYKELGFGFSSEAFLENLKAWMDSGTSNNGKLLRSGSLRPGHLDPEGQTMQNFFRYVRWTNGEDIYS